MKILPTEELKVRYDETTKVFTIVIIDIEYQERLCFVRNGNLVDGLIQARTETDQEYKNCALMIGEIFGLERVDDGTD